MFFKQQSGFWNAVLWNISLISFVSWNYKAVKKYAVGFWVLIGNACYFSYIRIIWEEPKCCLCMQSSKLFPFDMRYTCAHMCKCGYVCVYIYIHAQICLYFLRSFLWVLWKQLLTEAQHYFSITRIWWTGHDTRKNAKIICVNRAIVLRKIKWFPR